MSNFTFGLGNMCGWERKKAIYLMQCAEDLGIDWMDGYGELSVNPNSGNVYLWGENYNFALYMPVSCELKKDDVWVCYSDPRDGEETEKPLSSFRSLEEIWDWISDLEAASEEKEKEEDSAMTEKEKAFIGKVFRVYRKQERATVDAGGEALFELARPGRLESHGETVLVGEENLKEFLECVSFASTDPLRTMLNAVFIDKKKGRLVGTSGRRLIYRKNKLLPKGSLSDRYTLIAANKYLYHLSVSQDGTIFAEFRDKALACSFVVDQKFADIFFFVGYSFVNYERVLLSKEIVESREYRSVPIFSVLAEIKKSFLISKVGSVIILCDGAFCNVFVGSKTSGFSRVFRFKTREKPYKLMFNPELVKDIKEPLFYSFSEGGDGAQTQRLVSKDLHTIVCPMELDPEINEMCKYLIDKNEPVPMVSL